MMGEHHPPVLRALNYRSQSSYERSNLVEVRNNNNNNNGNSNKKRYHKEIIEHNPSRHHIVRIGT